MQLCDILKQPELFILTYSTQSYIVEIVEESIHRRYRLTYVEDGSDL